MFQCVYNAKFFNCFELIISKSETNFSQDFPSRVILTKSMFKYCKIIFKSSINCEANLKNFIQAIITRFNVTELMAKRFAYWAIGFWLKVPTFTTYTTFKAFMYLEFRYKLKVIHIDDPFNDQCIQARKVNIILRKVHISNRK